MAIRIGIIGGSGLGEALVDGLEPVDQRVEFPITPFGRPSGPIVLGRCGAVDIAILQRHGPGHVLNPGAVPYRANIYALKLLGCTHVLASGACGSLREAIRPGDLVICDQAIDRTQGRERTFYERTAVHVEFADPFCPVMRAWLLDSAAALGARRVHERGTYLCMEGPTFSTRAEAHVHRLLGADVIGMTALPEARLAREAELAYALLAMPTDFDCWRPRAHESTPQSLLREIIGNLRDAVSGSIALVRTALADVSPLAAGRSPAHTALDHAIWTDHESIDPAELERLRPLWGRVFGSDRGEP